MDYTGSSKVTIPGRLFEQESVLEKGVDVRWYVNKVTDVVLVTKNYLESDEYVFVASTSFADNDNSRTTVPAKLFDDYGGRGGHGVRPEKIRDVNWDRDGYLVFSFFEGMNQGGKQSCYVFTEDQYNQRFDPEGLDGVPRFA
jgi:hypothetical protein